MMKNISTPFEIYETKPEQFLNFNGRDWKNIYKTYVQAAKASQVESAKQNPESAQ